MTLSALVKKLKRSYTNNLTVHLRALRQKEANSPKRSRSQEIVKFRAEINQIETRKTIQRVSKTKSSFFERINKIDKPLAKLTKKKPRGSIKINKLRSEKGEITTER
jgi:superfamily II RNA helicase